MDPNHKQFELSKSASRIQEILDESDSSFPELKDVPSRDWLTYKNGCYVWVCALMVDMRSSTSLLSYHRRPTVSKIYKAFTSEMVGLINELYNCRDINIEGDGILAVFNARSNQEIQEVYSLSSRINSLKKLINGKLKKKNFTTINAGIGLSAGKTLMIKSGLKGIGVNEVTWIGNAIGQAAKLSDLGCKGLNEPVQLDEIVYNSLTRHQQSFCSRKLDGKGTRESNNVWKPFEKKYIEYC